MSKPSQLYCCTEQVHSEHAALHRAQINRGNWVPALTLHDHPYGSPCNGDCETLPGAEPMEEIE